MKTCPKCGFSVLMSPEEKSAAIKKGVRKTTKKLGRPRAYDHERAVALRELGLSYSEIARELKVNRGLIHYALVKGKISATRSRNT